MYIHFQLQHALSCFIVLKSINIFAIPFVYNLIDSK